MLAQVNNDAGCPESPRQVLPPGYHLIDAVQQFGDAEAAEAWLVARRWPEGIRGPYCESDRVAGIVNRKPMPWRCPIVAEPAASASRSRPEPCCSPASCP